MKTIVFFNNKGGVGKTTLACNVASFLQNEKRIKTILIDADPQCNATQLYYDDEKIDSLYIKNESKKSTLYYILKSIEDGDPNINTDFSIIEKSKSKYKTDVIAGHPRLSMLEDRLSDSWNKLIGGDIGGARVTNWVRQLLENISSKYDVAIIDVGPSLGALNRCVLLSSDYFLAPLGCDIFSILGIDNISIWIDEWSQKYDRSISMIKQGSKCQSISEYHIISDTSSKFMLCGYTVQQYVTKTVRKGEKRAVKAYDDIKKQIPKVIHKKLSSLTPERLQHTDLELTSIPYLYSLIPMSQSHHCPIYKLTNKEGVVGNQYAQVAKYKDTLSEFCLKLLTNIDYSPNKT